MLRRSLPFEPTFLWRYCIERAQGSVWGGDEPVVALRAVSENVLHSGAGPGVENVLALRWIPPRALSSGTGADDFEAV
jgi:hypothetical protein